MIFLNGLFGAAGYTEKLKHSFHELCDAGHGNIKGKNEISQ